jgi:cardiolipin synthase
LDGKNKWIERLAARTPKRESLVRLNFTARLRRRSVGDFLARVRAARERVWIANPYLVPSPAALLALKRAKLAGADIKILVPRRSDVFFMHWVATAFYIPLARAGAEIYEYLPRFLHQKSVIVDEWATVGTSNMNARSLHHDLEVDIVLSRAENTNALALAFQSLLRDAERVDQIPLTWPNWLKGFLGRAIALLFKNWI